MYTLLSANDNRCFTTDSSFISATVICSVSDNVTPFVASNRFSSHHDGIVESPFFLFPRSLDVVAGDRMMFTDAKPSTTDDEEEVESAFIHDADTLQIVAPLGYPFRDDLRQNLLLDWYTEVEPVSATFQSLFMDCEPSLASLPFFLQLVDSSVLNNGNDPSFVTIRPGDDAFLACCDMSNCVFR